MLKRHNNIVNRLKRAAAGRDWDILGENQRVTLGCTLRPDLVLTKGDEALIIDVAVPYENGPDAFAAARRRKVEKYSELKRLLESRFRTVSIEAVVVGSLGSWDRANDKVVARLCSKKYANLMRRLIVSDTIRVSREIYMEHITDLPQSDEGVDSLTRVVSEARNVTFAEDSLQVAISNPPIESTTPSDITPDAEQNNSSTEELVIEVSVEQDTRSVTTR
jgi:hypothetical protein